MTDQLIDEDATVPGRTGRRVSAFADDALGELDAVALAARVSDGEVSSGELVDAAIARAEQVNPDLNAVAVWDTDRARAAAAVGGVAGVLAGVPSFVKAISDYEGLPNRMGSRAMPDTPATAHGPEVEHFLSTGLVAQEDRPEVGPPLPPGFGKTVELAGASAATGLARRARARPNDRGGHGHALRGHHLGPLRDPELRARHR